jgi:hypothetical protein
MDPATMPTAPSSGTPEREGRQWLLGAAAIIVLAAVLGVLARPAYDWFRDDGSGAPLVDSLQLVVAGIPSELPAEVPVAGDIVATFQLIPADGRYQRVLDVELHHTGSGLPAGDSAQIRAIGSMRFMDHDDFRADSAIAPEADGHYRIPLEFSMPGEWQIDLAIETDQGPAELALFVEIWQ